jgi:TonB family protein
MLLLFLVSQLAAPTTTGPAGWYKADDYPIQYIEAGRSFDISLRLTVKPDGSLQGCAIEKSSGEKSFDKYNCALLLNRAKFSPAKDKEGRPILGIYRTRVTWKTDDRKPQPGAGDLELTVKRLPSGLSSPTYIQVALAVDGTGRASDCTGGKPDQNAALVKTACTQLLRSYRAIPARLPSGDLVPSVQSATVSFLTQ